jgi:hypothetical protein
MYDKNFIFENTLQKFVYFSDWFHIFVAYAKFN